MDERARQRLYRRLEEILGPEEAVTLMNHLPAGGPSDLATKGDLAVLDERLSARFDYKIEQMGRRLVMWTSSMVLASAALAFAAGRLA